MAATGAVLPLPFLASLSPGCEDVQQTGIHPLVVVRAASGVAQADGDDPELFWPHEEGLLDRKTMQRRDADRAVSELADFAEDLLLVRGTRYPFPASKELHAGGGNQLLTGARCGPISDSVMTYALGESIDNWIARRSQVNGGEPLTLYAGRRDNYGEEVLSYRGPQQLRGAESEPWAVYQRLIGGGGEVGLRRSVNDLVLDQLHALQADPRLSDADRRRLELHTDSVRDFEVMGGRLAERTEREMRELSGRSSDDEVSLEVARLHADLIALVLDSDLARAVTLQIGDRLDRARYTVDGELLPQYHELTHRIVPDHIADAEVPYLHQKINRLHLQVFHHLLGRLDERGLLSTCVAVWCSDIATGSHRYDQIPWVLAGAGDGLLRTGRFVDVGDETHDRLLATLLTATGHRTLDGAPIERFGDESLEGGLLERLLA